MPRVRSLNLFVGDRMEDAFDGGKRAVRQGAKAARKGTSYDAVVSLAGTVDGDIVEDSQRSAGLDIVVRPSTAVQAAMESEVGAEVDLLGTVSARVGSGIQWSVRLVIRNAAALADDQE